MKMERAAAMRNVYTSVSRALRLSGMRANDASPYSAALVSGRVAAFLTSPPAQWRAPQPAVPRRISQSRGSTVQPSHLRLGGPPLQHSPRTPSQHSRPAACCFRPLPGTLRRRRSCLARAVLTPLPARKLRLPSPTLDGSRCAVQRYFPALLNRPGSEPHCLIPTPRIDLVQRRIVVPCKARVFRRVTAQARARTAAT